jgi:putative OPT family oligopeptide transporter
MYNENRQSDAIMNRAPAREFTPRALILGTVLGMVFGASSLYLVLKVGLTVSASIPVAVISVALFRLWSKVGGRDATILEHNIVQTAGSAGESLAFGLGVTMPAILILGFDLELTRVMLVAFLGGLLGILMMIPLRRALIVQQHGELKYPEGTACAAVLKAGTHDTKVPANGTTTPTVDASTIFTGFGLGLAYKVLMAALRLWKDIPEWKFGPPLKGGSISAEISPELLGVGYIIGPRISCIMLAGGALSYLVLIPLITFFGAGSNAIIAPATEAIGSLDAEGIRGAYILYIGAGAVAAGGLISLGRSLPTILKAMRAGLEDFRPGRPNSTQAPRTDQDLSMGAVACGCVLLLGTILASPSLHMNILGALLILLFGFLFVTVSSRLTGEIGSSSNPISGMTVATLLLTCLAFLVVGWTGGPYYVTALSVGGIVCVAASNGGTTSQDLKTGFLVGGTPRLQQLAIIIGASASALALGPVLLGLNNAATVYVPIATVAPGLQAPANASLGKPEHLAGAQATSDTKTYRAWHNTDTRLGPAGRYLVNETGAAVYLVDPGINGVHQTRPDGTSVRKFDAPKATLMSYIIKGILNQQLPWGLVLFGVMITVVLELAGVPSLAFAVGLYLPISASTPIFAGGIIRWVLDLRARFAARRNQVSAEQAALDSDSSPGVLLASGYIAGGAIAGIVIAFLSGALGNVDAAITRWSEAHNPFFAGPYANGLSLLPFALLSAWLLWVGGRKARAAT